MPRSSLDTSDSVSVFKIKKEKKKTATHGYSTLQTVIRVKRTGRRGVSI